MHKGLTLQEQIDLLEEKNGNLLKRIEFLENQIIEPIFIIKIKYFDKDLIHINKIDQGNWIDLRAAEDVDIKAFETKKVSLGIAMELPEGYEAHVVPRSSLCKNFHVLQTNSFGVIDEAYKGDGDCWFVELYAIKDTHISKNDRICQFRIDRKMPNIEFLVIEKLGNNDRGGHGSTGIK